MHRLVRLIVVLALVCGLGTTASAQSPVASPFLSSLEHDELLEVRVRHLEREYDTYDTSAPWVLTFAGAAAIVAGGLGILTSSFTDSLDAWSGSPQTDVTPFGITMIAGAVVAVAGLAWFFSVAADRRAVATQLRAYRHALARHRAPDRGPSG